MNENSVFINKIDVETSINNYNIKDLVQQIDLYQDIYSPHISCNMYLKDVNRFSALLQGDEKINMSFTDVRNKSLVKSFAVYVSEEIDKNKNNLANGFSVSLISGNTLENLNTFVGGSFYGTTDYIIKKLFNKNNRNDLLQKLETDTDDFSRKFIIPLSYKFRAIQTISAFSKNFVFYETFDGYYYKNLEKLINKLPKNIYYMNDNKTLKSSHINDIISYRDYPTVNTLDNIRNGMFYKETSYSDILNKKSLDVIYDYNKEFKNINTITTIGFGNYAGQKLKQDINFGVDNSIIFNSNYRRSLLQQFNNNRVDIMIYPNFDLNVGDVIQIIKNSKQQNYLVTAVHHIIRENKSNTVLELSLNSRS